MGVSVVQLQATIETEKLSRQALSSEADLAWLLSDRWSRAIVTSTIDSAKSIHELSEENGIPLSTCYRRITELINGRFIIVERAVVSPSGKKYLLYRASIRGAQIEWTQDGFKVYPIPNSEISERLRADWISARFSEPMQIGTEIEA
jgi:hypothetical protein